MSRPRWIALTGLVLLLSLLPFAPHGGGDDGSIRPSGEATARPRQASYAAVSAADRRTIDAIAGAVARPLGGRTTPEVAAAHLVRCADFEGQRYCLGTGWTDQTQRQVQARAAVAARAAARPSGRESTGDLDAAGQLRRLAAMSPQQRERAVRAELTQAAQSVAKVALLRHEVLGSPLRMSPTTGRTTTGGTFPMRVKRHWSDYPHSAKILDPHHVAEQHETWWCGPTSAQMIIWGWKGVRQPQRHWADELGTTTSGTGITDMVRVVNQHTGWDNASHAGPYVTLDIGDWSFHDWMLLMMRHTVDYRAPVILHPVLLTQYYPYLDHDGSGHFQVGRGYRKRDGKPPLLGYFEPWDQQRFHPDEPYIPRIQWRNAYKSYRANEAHFQHNVGV